VRGLDKNTDKKLAELATSKTNSQREKPALTQTGKGKATATADFTIKTDVDDLIKLVERTKEISMADAAKELGVPPQTVESWSIFLEEDGVIEVRYKLTTPYLVAKSTADKNAAMADKVEKTDKKQMLLKDDSAETFRPKPKPRVDTSDISVPHLFKEANKEIDMLFTKAYDLIEEGSFSEADRIYEMIKQENDSLPANLKLIKKDISGNLTKLNKDIIVNLEKYNLKTSNDISRYVSSKLMEMSSEINSGNIRKAENTYADIQSALSTYPSGFESKKADLQSQVIITYRKLLSRKKELLQRYNVQKAGQVMALIREIRSNLQKNDIDAAFKKYEEARVHYNELPEGFSEENEQLSKILFSLVPEILATKKKYSSDEFNSISARLRGLIKSTYESLSQGKIEAAERYYEDIKQIYHTLPKEFFSKRIELERELLDLENQLLLRSRDTSFSKLKECKATIARMLSASKDYLKRDNVELAEGIYYEILHVYRDIPDGFLEQKTLLSLDTLNLYREILMKYDEDLLTELDEKTNAKYQKLVQVLITLRQDIEDSKYDIIEQKFEEAVDLFGHLPFRFVHENTKLWIEIQTLSDEIELFKKTKLIPAYKDNPSSLRSLLEEIRNGYANLTHLKEDFPDYSKLLIYVKNNYIYYYNLINRTNIKDIPIGRQFQSRPQPPASPAYPADTGRHPAILSDEIEPEMVEKLSPLQQSAIDKLDVSAAPSFRKDSPTDSVTLPPRIDNPNQDNLNDNTQEEKKAFAKAAAKTAEDGAAEEKNGFEQVQDETKDEAADETPDEAPDETYEAAPEKYETYLYYDKGLAAMDSAKESKPSKIFMVSNKGSETERATFTRAASSPPEEEVLGEGPKKQKIFQTMPWKKENPGATKAATASNVVRAPGNAAPQKEQKLGQDWKLISDFSTKGSASGITQTISPEPKLVYPKVYIMKEEQPAKEKQSSIFAGSKMEQPSEPSAADQITPGVLKDNLISNLMRTGEQMLKLGRIMDAEDAFTQIMAIDSFNPQAKERLEQITTLKNKVSPKSQKQKENPVDMEEPSFRLTKPWQEDIDHGARSATSFSAVPGEENLNSISSKLDSFEELINSELEGAGQRIMPSAGTKRPSRKNASKKPSKATARKK
jgi:hypothetical protein